MDDLPRWMLDCIEVYEKAEGRPPTTMELLAWREADASCRMERPVEPWHGKAVPGA